MACVPTASLTQLSLSTVSVFRSQLYSPKTLTQRTHGVFPRLSLYESSRALCFPTVKTGIASKRGLSSVCFNSAVEEYDGKSGFEWQISKRWDVPWKWEIISLTSLACGLSLSLTWLIESAAKTIPSLGILFKKQKFEIMFVDMSLTTVVVLGIIYNLIKYQPLGDDFFRYDWREPFNLQKGWLLWALFGLVGALMANVLTKFALCWLPGRETNVAFRLLPHIGSSSISIACLWGTVGVLAPLLEETVFRGFLMVSLTKWLPTPVAVLISALAFAIVHGAPAQIPQIFVFGTAVGFSYAQTRNLLTPIAMHAISNLVVVIFLTYLKVQGYDVNEILQAALNK